MVGGHLLVLLPQRFGAPMRFQQVADAVAQRGFLVFRDVDRVVENLRETASICSSNSRCCSCSSLSRSLAAVVVCRMRLRSISTNWSRVWTGA